LHLSAEQIDKRRARAAIRHVHEVHAGHHLEQFTSNMVSGTDAGRRHVDLGGIGLGIRDELGNRLGRHRGMHLYGKRLASDARNRRDVADEIKIELVVEGGVDRVHESGHKERISVRGAVTTLSVPMLLAAPGGFWMTIGWPSRSDSHCPIRRPMMSVPPAGANPTMMRTGRDG